MNALHFIQLFVSQHTQLIELFVACVILFIILIIWKPKKSEEETVLIPEETHPEPPSEDIINQRTEALNWWKNTDLNHKKLYAYDAQFRDRKISSLKGKEIEKIYLTFLENDSITTK